MPLRAPQALAGCLLAWLPSVACQEGGHWIFHHFVERMDCKFDRSDADFWEDAFAFVFQPAMAQGGVERMRSLSVFLEDLFVPFGVADPVAALSCPLGASAALTELATACVETLGAACAHRGLRLLHLSKLFVLFNFNDYGAWFGASRWRIDMNRLSSAMQELTRQSRADGVGAAVRVAEPLDFRDGALRLGLVTYCNYNDSRTGLTKWSRSSKRAYADHHGYTLYHYEEPFVMQAHPWMNKLIAVRKILQDFHWVFWVDCDLFFMNPRRTVDAVISSALQQDPEASLLIAEDGMMLNSGAFLLRNNAWGHRFLEQTMDLLAAPMPHSFQHMPWHEQAPLMYLSLVPALLEGFADGGAAALAERGQALSAGYDRHVALLPQRAINSYPPEVVARTGHALAHEPWQEGDLVISFNGCSSILGAEFCEGMYERYHRMSLDRFASAHA